MTLVVFTRCENDQEPAKEQEGLGIPVSTTIYIIIDESSGDTIEKRISTTYAPASPSDRGQIETVDEAEQQRIYNEWFQGMGWYVPN